MIKNGQFIVVSGHLIFSSLQACASEHTLYAKSKYKTKIATFVPFHQNMFKIVVFSTSFQGELFVIISL
jgi:hypothetical protein